MGKECLKEYIKYTVLNVMGMFGLSCYILADTYFVSKGLGSRGLAALNLAIPVYNFIHGSGLMFGMGGATRYSMIKSQGQREKTDKVFTHTFVLMSCFAVIFFLVGVFASEALTRVLGADEEVFSMCRTYLKVLLLFAPIFMMNDVILCFVRNDGAPQLSMAAMLSGSFANIILDYIFIFCFKMGIFGAVFATGFAPVISLSVMSPFFIKRKNQFQFMKCGLDTRLIKYVFSGGVPSLIAEVSSGIVMMLFNLIILKLEGNTGVAAYGVIANLSLVVIAVYTGIAQGIQPIISRYYGMNNRENVQKILKYAVITVIILSGVIYTGMFWRAGRITAIFNSEGNKKLQLIAVWGIKMYFTACIFAGLNIVLSVYFTSTNRAKPAGIISVLRGFLLILPMTFLLSSVWKMTGLWLAFPVTECLVLIVGIMLYKKYEQNGINTLL